MVQQSRQEPAKRGGRFMVIPRQGGNYRACLLRQADAAHQIDDPRLGTQAVKGPVDLQVNEVRIVRAKGLFQPGS